MGIISQEDIKGYNFKGIIVCTDCATANDEKNLKGDEILTEDHIEGDDFYFCDRCGVWLN